MEQALDRWRSFWLYQSSAPPGIRIFLRHFILASLGLSLLEGLVQTFHPGTEWQGLVGLGILFPGVLIVLSFWQQKRILAAVNTNIALLAFQGAVATFFFPEDGQIPFYFLLIGAIAYVLNLELEKYQTGVWWIKGFSLLLVAYLLNDVVVHFQPSVHSYTLVHQYLPLLKTLCFLFLFGSFFVPYFKKKHKSERQLQSDIQEQQQLYRKALKEQEELAQMRMQFVATASHQFRTPLTVLKTSSFLLRSHLEKKAPPAKLQQIIERIDNQTERLSLLMDNILVLGKENAENLTVDLQPTDLVSLVTTLLEDAVPRGAEAQVELKILGDPVPIFTNPLLLEHILINLLSNALKYSQGQPSPQVFIQFTENHFSIQVKDFGIGIATADQPFLFQPFWRGQNAQHIPGTGLGLVIVRQLTEKLGGEIALQSALDQGTTVFLKFPKTTTHEPHTDY